MIVTHLSDVPRSVVFVAGAFDPLHFGHLVYLDGARAFGRLCCGVDPDSYIERVKHRPPLLSQSTRVCVMNALSCVDYVVLMDDRVDAGVLSDLRPLMYVKGHDWIGRLPEAERQACTDAHIEIRFIQGPAERSSDVLETWYRAVLTAAGAAIRSHS